MTIYVDNAGIAANVTDQATGRSYNSRWCHLFSDQIDQAELHTFARRIGMQRRWFQPGKKLGRPGEHDPGGDHYDLTARKRKQAIAAGAVPVERERAVELWRAKRAAITAEAVTTAIRAHRYHFAHEDGLQAGITEALTAAGLPAEREVRLAPRDRVDVLSGGVGIEVKVAGSAESVLAQLQRYATRDRITALVLVTTRSTHRALPEQVGGKPLTVIHLGGAA